MKLTNAGGRRLGVPGRPALILDPNQTVDVDASQMDEFRRNRTVCRWLESGILVLSDGAGKTAPVPVYVTPKPTRPVGVKPNRDVREEVVLPKGITGEGVERNHLGGGWWEVYVNGFKVTDRNVRKDEAQSIAAEYE